MARARRELLVNQEVYHAYNRSIGNEQILVGKRELNRALKLIDYYRFPQKIRYSRFKLLPKVLREDYFMSYQKRGPLVEIYAYALMPDHYHLLLKQINDNGIKIFISKFQNGFAKYFNIRNARIGALFQRPFKTKLISKDEIFMHVSRYIHLNPITSHLVEYENHEAYPWTSYPDYLGKGQESLVNTTPLIKMSGSREKYEEFVANQVDYQRKLHLIKNYLLE